MNVLKLGMNNSFFRLLHALNRIRLWIVRPLTLGVRLILVRDGSVVLVRHTYQDFWFLPGGGVEKGETLEAAARREAREETGAQLGALTLHGVYTNFAEFKNDHVAVFQCTDFTIAPRANSEIAACQFFRLDALPPDLAPGHLRRLNEFLQKQNNPGFGMW